ncbi:MAG: tetratricopeptide repeat protein [Jaaginema sp. PMC 1079.18]|nr:tetratricopeptide repeat protein [Jaaginema sp. PMC 1080.18]MEC4850456.1 tetratricopeptide repeat protein [Jaaginema sp. PMC 1079.18]MEC4867520.1 tetratricopeptide repeat protein [Jaaginema sp. PMC 1078.18]
MPEPQKTKKPVQQIIIIFSAIAFLGSTALMAASMFTSPSPAPSDPEAETQAIQDELATQEEGFAAVVEREPDNEFALTRLVELRLQMQKYEAAVEPLQKLVELNPDNQQALQALAAVHIQTGNYEGAIAPLEKLVELNPEATELQAQLANIKEQVQAQKSGETQTPTSKP